MINPTEYQIDKNILNRARNDLPIIDDRLTLNQPNGSFFYDPWIIKSEYKNTVWEEILDSLKENKGEARLIKLKQGECYPSHADIDDRWHLNIKGNNSFLIDLENQKMYQTDKLGHWYSMDAGIKHTAANFGSEDRIQLVVRKLLPKPKIVDPVSVTITLKTVITDRRFVFDDVISPWLNRAYKKGIVSDFNGEDLKANFIIEKSYLEEFISLTDEYFIVSTQ